MIVTLDVIPCWYIRVTLLIRRGLMFDNLIAVVGIRLNTSMHHGLDTTHYGLDGRPLMGDYNMLNSKHTLPCQFLIKLGTIEYAKNMIPNADDTTWDKHERNTSISWFEGFATGLHEASVIDDKTYDELIDEISKIGLTFEATDDEHATKLLDETE